jgi:hypothetical protein
MKNTCTGKQISSTGTYLNLKLAVSHYVTELVLFRFQVNETRTSVLFHGWELFICLVGLVSLQLVPFQAALPVFHSHAVTVSGNVVRLLESVTEYVFLFLFSAITFFCIFSSTLAIIDAKWIFFSQEKSKLKKQVQIRKQAC